MPNDLGITATLLKLAERPEGVSSQEASSSVGVEHSRSVQRLLYEFCRTGRLHKAGPHMKTRWFTHPEHAATYARHVGSYGTPVTMKMHRAALGDHNRGPRAPDGEPVITERTKVTIAPTPRSRYQVDEAPRVVSSSECRNWAKEAIK